MFGLLGSSQIYGLQQVHEYSNNDCTNNDANIKHKDITKNISHTNNTNNTSHKQRNSTSGHTESGSKFFASLSSMQGIKSPTNFIEKFIKNELLNSYDTIKNYKNFQNSTNNSGSKSTFFTGSTITTNSSAAGECDVGEGNSAEGLLASFNCLQGSYRSNYDDEFYEPVNVSLHRKQTVVSAAATATTATTTTKPSITLTLSRNTEADMTIKYSKNLLANTPDEESPATLQNYQKLSECEQDLLLSPSSGASSGEFNSDVNAGSSSQTTTPVNSLYKRLSFGGRSAKSVTDNAVAGTTMSTTTTTTTATATNEVVSDYSSSTNSSSSASSTLSSNTTSISLKSLDLKRTSSASSSGDGVQMREPRKSSPVTNSLIPNASTPDATSTSATQQLTPERAQRRKLISMISHYEQQNKLLQRELAKEKRRRSEELACVAKSLLCFESKLKKDMKSVNQRLLEKDNEICRLVQQNRALRKRLAKITEAEGENARDEGVVEDGEPEETEGEEERSGKAKEAVLERETAPTSTYSDKQLLEDCLVLEALQCINCKKQFYDIDLNENWTKNVPKDGTRKNADHTTEHGSSSDDTVSSSFYGARRSVRYTSKRTSGTFRDYMRSRAMNIDDPALDNNSEENTSTISRDDSQTSYEKLNIYSRTIERMHGVKVESERESEQSGMESIARPNSRLSCKSSASSKSSKSSAKSTAPQIEEDDGIFSPTQDDDFEDAEEDGERSIKIVVRRSTDFSEASPKQVYETSTDDWYASASDQEENAPTAVATKLYAQGAVNPVLECVNQILLQQSMEEPVAERTNQAQTVTSMSPQNLTLNYSNVTTTTANLPRRSSLSGRRSSRSNSRSSDGQPSHNGTLTRKRVHFSTKNSMVHVPRNDEHDEEDEDADQDTAQDMSADSSDTMISSLAQYQPMSYYPQATQQAMATKTAVATTGTISRGGMLAEVAEHERLETLNYESIYSNEYEPIGSEHNSSNLYVDMDATNKTTATNATSNNTARDVKVPKIPPALPPKPANLLKFKKSLQQLDELPDEHLHQDGQTTIEPDYCSISEVNVGITSVQIVADVHKAPESEVDLESNSVLETTISELDVEVSTVASDETFAASQKTDEIEEIFADVPKLPNVAAIIAPKQAKFPPKQHLQSVKCALPPSDYLVMSPKVETPNMKLQNARNATILNTATAAKQQTNTSLSSCNNKNTTTKVFVKPSVDYLNTPVKSTNRPDASALKLHIHTPNTLQYKRKHMPNILAEINKRMSLPNSPTTPTARVTFATPTKQTSTSTSTSTKQTKHDVNALPNMPMQAEFDWYNLDAEYGRTTLQQPDLLKVNDTLSNGTMLAGIHEDGESIATTADEYNLDEEFSLANDKPDVLNGGSELDNESAEEKSDISVVAVTKSPAPTTLNKPTTQKTENIKMKEVTTFNATICEAVNFPMFNESSPLVVPSPIIAQPHHHAKAKKIKKNLANFEKFIEGSGLSTKPLPSKRKIYFAGPFV